MHNRIITFEISCLSKTPLKRRRRLWPLNWNKNWSVVEERKGLSIQRGTANGEWEWGMGMWLGNGNGKSKWNILVEKDFLLSQDSILNGQGNFHLKTQFK